MSEIGSRARQLCAITGIVLTTAGTGLAFGWVAMGYVCLIAGLVCTAVAIPDAPWEDKP